jgi:hypothetical protein
VTGIDGRLVFRGPRVAFAIHRAADYDIVLLSSPNPTAGALRGRAALSLGTKCRTGCVKVTKYVQSPHPAHSLTGPTCRGHPPLLPPPLPSPPRSARRRLLRPRRGAG